MVSKGFLLPIGGICALLFILGCKGDGNEKSKLNRYPNFYENFHFPKTLSRMSFPDILSTSINKFTKNVLPESNRRDLVDLVKDTYKNQWSGWYRRYFRDFGTPKYQQSLFQH